MLRHRRLLSTAIYAKTDTQALRALARPWPAAVRHERPLRQALAGLPGGPPVPRLQAGPPGEAARPVHQLPGRGRARRRSPPSTRWPGRCCLAATRPGTPTGWPQSAGSPPGCAPSTRLREVPPARADPVAASCRATPYLYADDDITALITAAASLRFPLREATYQTLIGLLAVTGMRVGEAIGLDRGDVDLDGGVLTVRERQARQVPAGPGARHHRTGAWRLPAAPGRPAPDARNTGGVHLPGRDQAALLQRARHLETAGRVRRAPAPVCGLPSAHP